MSRKHWKYILLSLTLTTCSTSPDPGVSSDGGSDSGPDLDAGLAEDSGAERDSGQTDEVDAGSDAATGDAGDDGTPDAGADAGMAHERFLPDVPGCGWVLVARGSADWVSEVPVFPNCVVDLESDPPTAHCTDNIVCGCNPETDKYRCSGDTFDYECRPR